MKAGREKQKFENIVNDLVDCVKKTKTDSKNGGIGRRVEGLQVSSFHGG